LGSIFILHYWENNKPAVQILAARWCIGRVVGVGGRGPARFSPAWPPVPTTHRDFNAGGVVVTVCSTDPGGWSADHSE